MERLLTGIRHSMNITGRSITGVWLLLFYFFSIWLVLGTLSSHQFQEKIRMENESGAGVSIAAVRQLLDFREQLSFLEEELNSGEVKNREIRSQRNIANIQLVQSQKNMDDLELRIEVRLRSLGITDIPERLSEMNDGIKEKLSLDNGLKELYEEYAAAVQESNRMEKKMEELNLELEQCKSSNLETRSRHDLLIQQQSDTLSRHEALKAHLNDLIYMRKIRVDFLATMPAQLLTLILTLSMGALGSVISLTRSFFDTGQSRSFTWYLFRPFLGMVTAIAIFILAKAGQIIITDTSIREGSTNNLNPFFISFLAIISGLLSEQAYEKIQRSGYSFFGVEKEGKERWAFRLKREMETKEKDAAEITEFMGIPPKLVQDWMEERYPVPDQEQKMLSIWLNRHVRDIFSDLPPEPKEIAEEKSGSVTSEQ